MIDIAQLREALAVWHPHDPQRNDNMLEAIADAARELLTIREAGALIITPNEKTVDRIAHTLWNARMVESYTEVAEEVLDALRDAMPDGET